MTTLNFAFSFTRIVRHGKLWQFWYQQRKYLFKTR